MIGPTGNTVSSPQFEMFGAILEKTAQKMKFPIKESFSKCDEICSFMRIWSNLLKKSLIENSIFVCNEMK